MADKEDCRLSVSCHIAGIVNRPNKRKMDTTCDWPSDSLCIHSRIPVIQEYSPQTPNRNRSLKLFYAKISQSCQTNATRSLFMRRLPVLSPHSLLTPTNGRLKKIAIATKSSVLSETQSRPHLCSHKNSKTNISSSQSTLRDNDSQ